MTHDSKRKTPEQLLREVQAEETATVRRGHLKIFLGYASGVGKTVRMLGEARRRRERGQDVVVGAMQPHAPPEAMELLRQLEVAPLLRIGDGTAIDVEALLRRRPAICIIDGLAYDNPPGARHPARWQDVRELVDAGLKVIGSINIQYVEELRDEVESITGKHVTETVPVSFIHSADEIEVVDAPATTHAKLRELALVLAADVVDRQLSEYLGREGLHQQFGTVERIMVCVTPRANVEQMVETARVIADRFHGEMIAAYVDQPEISEAERHTLEQKLGVARKAGASVEMLEGEDPIETIIEFARSRNITQLFIGHSQQTGIRARWGNPVDRLIQFSKGMDVRIFPQRR